MKYSIITINYNDCEGLRKTIESVVNQTYSDYEYIIIDGGSTDGSVDVIKEYGDKISFWISEPDRGIYNAMNKGISHVHGDYCNFMNAGDCFYDENVLEDIRNYEEDIIVGKVVNSCGKEVFFHPATSLSMYFLYSGTIAHQGAFIRSTLQKQYPYDEKLKIVADWKFFVQAVIMDNCTLNFISKPVCIFDTTGLSSSNPQMTWQEKELVLKQYFPDRVLTDYKKMKESECLTQEVACKLRQHYLIDKLVYKLATLLLRFF